MSANHSQFLAFATEKEKISTTNLKSLVAKYLYNWPGILASIVLFLIIAFVYIQFTDPVYQIKATLLVNPEKTTASPQEGQSVLDKIDLPSTAEVVENELAKLKSAKLINQVINDLQLTISYQQKKGLLYKDLYSSLPFKLRVIKFDSDFESLTKRNINIQVKDKNSFLMENADGKFVTYSFNTIMHTAIGIWKLDPSDNIASFKGEAIKITLFDADKLTDFYQKNINATLEDKLATAIDLTLNTNIKQKGKDIINHLIEVYNADEIGDKNKETQNTIKFIDQRLSSLTGELTNAEKNIENFKSENKLTDITSDAKFELDKLQSNDSRLSEINVQLSIIDGIDKYVNSPHNGDKAPAVIGIADPSLASSIEKLSQLQLQRDQMLATTPATSPDFEQINSQIQTTRNSIKEIVKNIKSSLNSAKDQLQSNSSSSESSISNLPSQERQFISIKRQQSIKENLYVYLLQKREEVSLSYASTVSNYKVLDGAYSLPSKWPNSKIIYAIAFLLGIILPAVVIYAIHLVKGVIVDPTDIETALETNIFSEVTFDNEYPAIADSKGLIREQFRSLRAKLNDLHGNSTESRVTLLTSSISGEGKSFISSNLGVVLASLGRKTIVLELDLRRSSISDIFKLPRNSIGITDYLNDKVSLGKIIQPSGIPSLDIIFSGTFVSNPSELLATERLNEMINSLKETYDDIIIDSPPIHLVADAFILAKVSDITLYVVRQGVTKRSELKFIKEIFQSDKFPKIQVVFNGVNNKKFGYGYEYDNSYYNEQSKKK